MEKRKRYAEAGLVAVVLIIAAGFVLKGNGSGLKKSNDMVGVYEISAAKDGEAGIALFQMMFDAGTMTYEQKMIKDEASYTLDSGSYGILGGEVQVYSEVSDENTLTYAVDGDYIVAKDFLYEGNIGSGETFDAVCILWGKDMTYEVTFNADGRYTEKDTPVGGTVVETFSGTYERDGDFIRRMDDKKTTVTDFYIYQGQITNSYYEKAK